MKPDCWLSKPTDVPCRLADLQRFGAALAAPMRQCRRYHPLPADFSLFFFVQTGVSDQPKATLFTDQG
jgi:hypothetical protein